MDTHSGLHEDFARLVDVGRGLVNRRIFVDEGIYRLELERVFGRCWLYLAHESQLPAPGDYVNVKMGVESVLVCRDEQGNINALLNNCRHRANSVCRADQGNAKSFVCPYHGWTYDTKGRLIGVPGLHDTYVTGLEREKWGLIQVPQVESYGGLIFANLDPEAPSLGEFLGDMRWGLDLLLAQGDLVAVPGIARWAMGANWKFAADNAIGDMYHGHWTHRSAMLAGHASGSGTGTGASAVTRALQRPGFTLVTEYGHGFNADFVSPEQLNSDSPLAAWRKDEAVQRRLGALRGKVNRANMLVFPNLFVNSGSRELMLRNPLGPTSIEIWKTTLVDRNAAPELQRRQIRASNRHFGPAGMFEQDDGENWAQSTRGAESRAALPHDLNYAMGVGNGNFIADGASPARIDVLVNEHAQLWMYKCWAEYMDAANWRALKANHGRPQGRI
jgi:phenylpropionate dioxygenase-like ring-hydroxylating dioxygenase large terminal subunit